MDIKFICNQKTQVFNLLMRGSAKRFTDHSRGFGLKNNVNATLYIQSQVFKQP
jgi:hypothetical protein